MFRVQTHPCRWHSFLSASFPAPSKHSCFLKRMEEHTEAEVPWVMRNNHTQSDSLWHLLLALDSSLVEELSAGSSGTLRDWVREPRSSKCDRLEMRGWLGAAPVAITSALHSCPSSSCCLGLQSAFWQSSRLGTMLPFPCTCDWPHLPAPSGFNKTYLSRGV